MTDISEMSGNQGQIRGPLAVGLNVIDEQQIVAFTLYYRRVLPADGFVFWINSALVNESGLSTTFNARGSLHHTTVNSQDESESMSIHQMVFTSLQVVDQLAAIESDSLWLGETAGQKYAFSSRSSWYRQAHLWHYTGDAVYPPLSTQVVDTLPDLTNRIVSNSLPIWLTLNTRFPLFPSMIVPDNMDPPFASVHIGEDDTSPMMAGAYFDKTKTRWQLSKDRVRVVTYGVRNDEILDWIDDVQDYCIANPSTMGIMNSPIPKDAKRGQVEISTLAQKKVIEFEVDYYQSRSRDVARQLITTALMTTTIAHYP